MFSVTVFSISQHGKHFLFNLPLLPSEASLYLQIIYFLYDYLHPVSFLSLAPKHIFRHIVPMQKFFSVCSWLPLPAAILCLAGQALKGQASGHDQPDRKGPSAMLSAICQLLSGIHQPLLQWLAQESRVSALHKCLDFSKRLLRSSGTQLLSQRF